MPSVCQSHGISMGVSCNYALYSQFEALDIIVPIALYICENCESLELHPRTHLFYKVRIPAQFLGMFNHQVILGSPEICWDGSSKGIREKVWTLVPTLSSLLVIIHGLTHGCSSLRAIQMPCSYGILRG